MNSVDGIMQLLTQLELTSKARVEKLLTYCTENALTSEAAEISSVSIPLSSIIHHTNNMI